jgi:hypothetical protein
MVRPGENPEGRGRLPFWSFASRRSSEVRIAGRRVGAQSQASLLLEQRRWVGQDVPESSDFVIDDLGVWVSDPAEPVAHTALEPARSVRRVERPRRLRG